MPVVGVAMRVVGVGVRLCAMSGFTLLGRMGRAPWEERGMRAAMVAMTAITAMMDRNNRVGPQPDHEGSQREHKRGSDRGGGHPGGVAAVRPHLRSEEQDRHERDQWHEPGKSEEQRELGGGIHQRKSGGPVSP